jgi:hypothetical protein
MESANENRINNPLESEAENLLRQILEKKKREGALIRVYSSSQIRTEMVKIAEKSRSSHHPFYLRAPNPSLS